MSELMELALAAQESGDINQAKRLLSQALIQQPANEAAWMLMADLVDDVKQRRNCLERVVAINPKNTDAILALSRLDTSPLAPITRGERDKPLSPPIIGKTPPFTMEPGMEQYGTENQTRSEQEAEQPEQPAEVPPTFDWANESKEPDKTIDKIFTAVSSPESAYQPQSESELSWMSAGSSAGQGGTSIPAREETEARLLDELVGNESGIANEQLLAGTQIPRAGSEPRTGISEAGVSEEPSAPLGVEYMLWDNPKAKKDRMVILGYKSLIVANPKPSDVPHIRGLFTENKMIRDLLGEDTGMIRLDSISRVTANPHLRNAIVEYPVNKKINYLQLLLSSEQELNEFLDAIQERLGQGFKRKEQVFSMVDKVIPPVVILLLAIFLGWGIVSGLPMLSNLPASELGSLQVVVSTVERIVSSVGAFYLILILLIGGLLSLIWLINNLSKPSRLIFLERMPTK